ncbi:MAG TPA: 2-oxoglutarate and iron-dependent oxygenase domain-containing protein [Polyangiaceae bacterium]|nr:2-oxoglutarate and iron-dependent oxygenase domain-containing protein [Polyangiaceae bacterium]
MKGIPHIDLTPALAPGNDEAERRLAMEMDRVCKDVGFFTVRGHGIDRRIFEDVYAASKAFFDLPYSRKTGCRLETGFTKAADDYTPYGYSGLLEENAYAYMGERDKPSDYVEKFSVGRLVLDDRERLPFPEDALGRALRRTTKAYFIACEGLVAKLTELFTIALELPRDFFAVRTGSSTDSLRSQRYPARSTDFKNDQGMGAHCDGTLLTLLTHTSPGLEVRNRSGEWISPQVGDCDLDEFIVNIGDLMARWSNDEYVSTPHRVVLAEKVRQSIVFFKLANDDTVIECFPKFCRNKPAKYAPVLYKNFSLEKMNALFSREPREPHEAVDIGRPQAVG